MFKSPFSFEGRIRRTEYGLSVLIYAIVIIIVQLFLVSAMSSGSSGAGGVGIFAFILWLPCLFFLWAQGAKRCHDLGNSGWFQLIPFYSLWMLFADSKPGINEYGPNPKNIGNEPEFAFEENEKY